jgi:hypothetical protein
MALKSFDSRQVLGDLASFHRVESSNGSTDGWEREREAIFFTVSFFQFLMNGFNADAPNDWL